MAWIKVRTTDGGDKRFVACYRDPGGRRRSAGTYSSRRAAHREEAKVRDGAWQSASLCLSTGEHGMRCVRLAAHAMR